MKYKLVAAWLLSVMFAFGVLTNMQSESFGQDQERGMRGGQRGQRGPGGQRGRFGGQRGQRGGQRGQRGGRGGDNGTALIKGEVAPDFVLKSLDGESETKLSDFRGKKPVVLFFGSYT